MTVPLRFQCLTCQRRTYWCRYCKVRHCSKCSPHPSKRRRYLAKNHIIQRRNGQTIIMSARRYAHLKGASKGGSTTASRPNPGRFTSETARKAASKAWATRWRHSVYDPTLRIGRPRKNRPAVDRQALRMRYSEEPEQGIEFISQNWFGGDPTAGYWSLTVGNFVRRISERVALQRLGHLPIYRKNWVPAQDEPIIKTTVGKLPALKRQRKDSR